MPRKPREEFEGAVHHVYARGNGKQRIYVDDADRRSYLATLAYVAARTRWRCLAYCLMDNHVHLLLETPKPNLGAGMQRLHGAYATAFNRRHRRTGHLFEGRFGAVRIRDDEQLWTVAAYIARNPVQAGLCEWPEQWRWSSFASTIHGPAPEWLDTARLLSYFGGPAGSARARYGAFVGGLRPVTYAPGRATLATR